MMEISRLALLLMSVHRVEEEHEQSVFYVETGMDMPDPSGKKPNLRRTLRSIAGRIYFHRKGLCSCFEGNCKINRKLNLPTSEVPFSLYALIL